MVVPGKKEIAAINDRAARKTKKKEKVSFHTRGINDLKGNVRLSGGKEDLHRSHRGDHRNGSALRPTGTQEKKIALLA